MYGTVCIFVNIPCNIPDFIYKNTAKFFFILLAISQGAGYIYGDGGFTNQEAW